jgi:hypothetical protein
MSEQNETNKLMQEFLDTMQEVIVCPYCGDQNQLDPPLPCCGEVHAEQAWLLNPETDAEVLLYDSDLQAAFNKWKEERTNV